MSGVWTVFSKHKSAKDWQVERSYTLKSYADEVAKSIRDSGKMAKIKRR